MTNSLPLLQRHSASFSIAIAWCLLEAWIPWKHNLISGSFSIQVVQIRWPLSPPSFCVSGISSSSLMRMAACHISLEHVRPLSPVISLKNSVTALALFVAALQASMFDLGLWCTHHSSTLSRASSHLTAFLSSSSGRLLTCLAQLPSLMSNPGDCIFIIDQDAALWTKPPRLHQGRNLHTASIHLAVCLWLACAGGISIDSPHEPHGQASVKQGVAISSGMSHLFSL
jgi:hypothetical protein